MPKAYISGALSNIENPDEIKGFYEAIAEVCSRYGHTPYVPHLYNDPIYHPDVSPREVYENDKSMVRDADVMIAYVGISSLGVGMELAYADVAGLPIILLYEEGKYVSRFPRGIPTILTQIKFTDYRDALVKLGSVLEKLDCHNLSRKRLESYFPRQLYLSLKEADNLAELHVEVSQEMRSTTQKLTVKDGSNGHVLIVDVPSDDRNILYQELLQLANRGVAPDRVRVDHPANIIDIVQTVWPNAIVSYR